MLLRVGPYSLVTLVYILHALYNLLLAMYILVSQHVADLWDLLKMH